MQIISDSGLRKLRDWWANEYTRSVLDNETYKLLDEAITEIETHRSWCKERERG